MAPRVVGRRQPVLLLARMSDTTGGQPDGRPARGLQPRKHPPAISAEGTQPAAQSRWSFALLVCSDPGESGRGVFWVREVRTTAATRDVAPPPSRTPRSASVRIIGACEPAAALSAQWEKKLDLDHKPSSRTDRRSQAGGCIRWQAPVGGVWAWPGTFGVWGAPDPRVEAEGNRARRCGARGRNALADSPSAMRADLTAATVEDVCEWVGSLGLEEYVATFQH